MLFRSLQLVGGTCQLQTPTTTTTTKLLSTMDESGFTVALLRSLQFSGVKFLRYFVIDAFGNTRCKVRPIDDLLRQGHGVSLRHQASIAAVCFAGLPFYADVMVHGSGMDAKNVLTIEPDMNSLRILPYAPKSAIVIGDALDQYTNAASPLCTRSVLKRVIREAEEKHNVSFSVGTEIEFCLLDAATNQPVDHSLFANSVTLNDQEEILADMYDQLKQQHIPVEMLHAESGPGQVEIVLRYSTDPLVLADNLLLAKETIRAVARKHGLKALFAPKYNLGAAGSGLHIHVSTRNATTKVPNFCNGNELSPEGGSVVEGILSHLPAILGLTLPTVNSFRRVGKGCWTGSEVGWAVEDKESAVRVCSDLKTRDWGHVEFKLCDHTANIYLAIAGILHAGLDGLSQGMTLRPPLSEASPTGVATPLPSSASKAMDCLLSDCCMMGMLGAQLGQGYLAVRRNEVERAEKMSFDEEVQEFLSRA